MRPLLAVLAVVLVSLSTAALPAPVAPPSVAKAASLAPLPVYNAFKAALGDCGPQECPDIAREGLAGLAASMTSLPEGAAGPSAWLRFAALQAGALPDGLPTVATVSAPQAVLGLYGRLDMPVTDGLQADVERQTARLLPTQQQAFAHLIGSLTAALDLSRDAVQAVDVALLTRDPVRLHHLATFVGSAPPGTASAALAMRWDDATRELAKVDRTMLASAAMLVADAAERDLPSLRTASVSLPFIELGGDGDSTWTTDYVLLVDHSGSDTYLNHAGAGLFAGLGIGLAVDEGEGDDTYTSAGSAQGFGLAGVGILLDEGGNDAYTVTQFGQGASVAGVGLLYDQGAGDDTYLSPPIVSGDVITEPIATKASALAGIGVLVDEGGHDQYRQDGLDGFAYGAATGIGVLADRGGNDEYVAKDREHYLCAEGLVCEYLGNFTGPVQVSAEINAAAILLDESGDDAYECGDRVRQGCQGAAGGGAFSALLDLAGDDSYWAGVSFSEDFGHAIDPSLELGIPIFTMGQGSAYGPSAAGGVGVLFDGAGLDTYTAQKWAQGFGSVGFAALLDDGGAADTYATQAPWAGSRADGGTWAAGPAGFGADR